MKNPRHHFAALAFVIALALPVVFNACQAGLLGGKGFSAASSSLACKAVLHNGKVQKLSDLPVEPDPFESGKVQLRPPSSTSAQAKATGPVTVPAGSELAFIADNSCLNSGPQGFFSQVALASNEFHRDLPTQAYRVTLGRDYTDVELGALADQDSCVSGVSWNHKYKLQAYNDAGRLQQSHLNAIKADESYPYFYNSSGGMERTGANLILVAVVDTGVDWQHPDLYDNLWKHSLGIGIDITTLGGTISYDPQDISGIGHGTHVSGLIAAVTDNAVGVAGAMPFRVQVMPIKLFAVDGQGELTTTSQHFANAIRFAWENGAKVINLSVGNIAPGPLTDSIAEQAVNLAVQNGAVVVTVIGNADGGAQGALVNGTTLSSIPGMYSSRPGVLGVGSYDTQTGLKSQFSHYSTTFAEIGAPGADLNTSGIFSTLPRSLSSYGRLAGTSQSAPLVSAAAALAMAILKDATNVFPSPQEVERLILASAEKNAALAPFFKEGNKLDLHRLAQRINTDYPQTQSGNSIDLSSVGCQ